MSGPQFCSVHLINYKHRASPSKVVLGCFRFCQFISKSKGDNCQFKCKWLQFGYTNLTKLIHSSTTMNTIKFNIICNLIQN